MNKNILAAVFIGILVIVGAGVFVLNNKSAKPEPSSNIGAEVAMENGSSEKSSLRDLMGSSVNQVCTFSDIETGGAGTMYLGAGQARADFEVSTEAQGNLYSHMVSDGENIYIWFDGEEAGFKASLANLGNDISEPASESETGKEQSFDVDRQVDYECQAWAVDQSKFVLPSDIEFTDFTEIMENVMQPGQSGADGDIKAQQCAVCDSLTGDSQVQCKKSLGC